MPQHTIYSLHHPETLELRYVGQTRTELEERVRQHISKARNQPTNHKDHWIRSLLEMGLKPKPQVIEVVSQEVWEAAEIFWIKWHRDHGFRLTNICDGGQAGPSLAGKAHPLYGKDMPVRSREKQAEAMEEWWDDEDRRQKRSEKMKGKWKNPEYRNKLIQSFRESWDKDRRRRLSESLQGNKRRREFTDEEVKRIRKLYATGDWTLKELGQEYNVSITAIHDIVKRKTYADVE